MEVQPYGRGVFEVTAHGETLTVDVLMFRGNGCCSCLHFSTRLKPEIERLIAARQFTPGPRWKCPHIVAADAALLSMFKAELIKQFPDNNQTV